MSTNRFGNLPEDNTGRLITQDHQNPAFSATIGAVVSAQRTTVVIPQMTGAVTLNITEDLSLHSIEEGDEITIMASADGSARTVTLGTKLKGADLVLLAAESGLIKGVYDGTDFLCGTIMQST